MKHTAIERPLTWIELRDRKPVEATKEVPRELRNLWAGDLSVRRKFKVSILEKGEGCEPEPARPYRPEWMGAVVKPRPAPRLFRPPLRLRGLPVKPLIIWGADDRRQYWDTSYPWGCVCRIHTGLGYGSGVLVGPRHVLTASHVVDWWGESGAYVVVNPRGLFSSATAWTEDFFAFTKIRLGVNALNVDEDYAVLVTDQRLGDRFGWMGVRTYDSGWDYEDMWTNIGYPSDVVEGRFPIRQGNMKLDEDEFDYGSGRAMTTAADMMPGQSGGPMFGFWPDGPYVVAVAPAVGEIYAYGDENWCSGGSDLTRLVNEARARAP